jgi:hypothetical protein
MEIKRVSAKDTITLPRRSVVRHYLDVGDYVLVVQYITPPAPITTQLCHLTRNIDVYSMTPIYRKIGTAVWYPYVGMARSKYGVYAATSTSRSAISHNRDEVVSWTEMTDHVQTDYLDLIALIRPDEDQDLHNSISVVDLIKCDVDVVVYDYDPVIMLVD